MELFCAGYVNRPTRCLAYASVAAACNRYPHANYGFNISLLSRIQASNFGKNTDYMHVVSTHNISIIVVECVYVRTYLCTVAPLADPEYIRMVAPQFERKKVANLCVRIRASEQII